MVAAVNYAGSISGIPIMMIGYTYMNIRLFAGIAGGSYPSKSANYTKKRK